MIGRHGVQTALLIGSLGLACSCGDRPGETAGAGAELDSEGGAAESGTGEPIPCPHVHFGEVDGHWLLDAEAQDLVARDLDGDGLPELVVARDRREIVVLRNRGRDASIRAAFDTPVPIEGRNAWGVAVTDWNQDGLPDLAAVGGRVILFENRGGLTFELANDDVRPEHNSENVRVADMNANGREDIIVYGGRGVAVYAPPAVVGGPPELSFSLELGPLGLRRGDVGDLDADGIPDLAMASWVGDPFLIVAYGDGKGGFERVTTHSRPELIRGLEATIVDVDADGLLDVVVGGSTWEEDIREYADRKPRIVWMRGIGGGALEEAGSIDALDGNTVWSVKHADLDEDGVPEIVALAAGIVLPEGGSIPGAHHILSYRNASLEVVAPAFLDAGTAWGKTLLEDLDGDGFVDFVRATGSVSVRWGCPH